MGFCRTVSLVCVNGSCKAHFRARDAHGAVRTGASTVRDLIASGVSQKCPKCRRKWKIR